MNSMTKPIFDFSDYIAERTQDFTGREWVFAEIDAWLATPDAPRYFIITGEPGIGKTALAGRMRRCRSRAQRQLLRCWKMREACLHRYGFC